MTTTLILLAEDNVMIGMMMQLDLQDAGYEVAGPAVTNAAALKLLAGSRPALALVDIDLKDGDSGLDLARTLKDEFDVPTLFVTGQTQEASGEALGVLTKPFQSETLLSSVEAALDYIRTGTQPAPQPGLIWF
ncbi:response regulator [Parvularcula dongshanensis]|uniref:DNA-binding response OmpR family regulator n=1 Tax=Parvularcula dongshanensis TaxID=1173995 RepID=A0A840I3B0_9PROT|nr:response regulator [Parvularcula dongshanensis]MBB4658694.1 DNA-binding response OmpR family regulator [Parvularcula dongshanensis]